MKKILVMSLLAASICFSADNFAEHEAKMQQMQERNMNQQRDGSGEQNRNRYRNRKGNSDAGTSGPQDGTGNQYKGSRSGGGGRR